MRERKHTQLWDAVRQLILDNYDLLKKRRVRGGWYIVGDMLFPLVGSKITLEDYNWYISDQGYASLRDEIWVGLEQKKGLERPEVKPVGVVYERGVEYPVSQLEHAWDRARGFIFVEKVDEAEDLKPLSGFGWIISAGQGYPTRLVRKLLKPDARPVVAVHDFDPDGKGIYRALGFETRRTKHLDIALGKRVVDLGLTERQTELLKLPSRPSPPKYKGVPRVELSALQVLSTRMKLENPVLAFVVAAMVGMGLTLSPTEEDKVELMKRYLRSKLTTGLFEVADAVVEAYEPDMRKMRTLKGKAVEGELQTKIDFPDSLIKSYLKIAADAIGKTEWKSERDLHRAALKQTTKELLELLSEKGRAE